MVGQLSTYDDRFAHRAGSESCNRARSLRDTGVCAILPGSLGLRPGHHTAHKEASEARALSVLAELLTPFAGNGSRRLAEQLIGRFGTLDRMLSASERQIVAACEGRSEVGSMIAGARALVLAAMQETVTRSTVDPSDPKLERYLALKFKGCPHEELHAIFVDNKSGFIAEELVSLGSANKVEARVAPILRRALELGAFGFYLIHNHPSRVPEPSVEDVRATKQIILIASALELTVLDHLIIAGNCVVSMRRLKLL